jgi:hypothetical protein
LLQLDPGAQRRPNAHANSLAGTWIGPLGDVTCSEYIRRAGLEVLVDGNTTVDARPGARQVPRRSQHTDKPGTRINGLVCFWPRSIAIQAVLTLADLRASNGSVELAEGNLREAMQQLFARRYKTRFYKLEFGKSVVRTYTPEKSFGSILVGIGFASYFAPVLRPEVEVTPSHKDKSHVKYTTR